MTRGSGLDAENRQLRLVPSLTTSWDEVFSGNYSFDTLRLLADDHEQILRTGSQNEIRSIAHLHALELLPEVERYASLWGHVLSYIDQMLEKGEIDPLTVREIHKTNGNAICFSRIKTDKPTGKLYNDSGLLLEAVRMYPSGSVVRTHHSTFKNHDLWDKAMNGQDFFYALVEFVNGRLGSRNILTEDEHYVAEILEKAAPICPLLEATPSVLSNVFVNATDLQDTFKRQEPSIDERVEILSEVTDIDLVTAYFSREFKKTKRGKLFYKKDFWKKRFTPKDYRREVFEEILLGADKEFFAELVDNGVISTAGRVSDEKAFKVFYEADDERTKVLRLLDIVDSGLDEQHYFAPFDLNLGNVMLAENDGMRRYTHIDFESSREDCLEAVLFNRWAESGIYDHKGSSFVLENGVKAEDALLDRAYSTLTRVCRMNDEEAPSKEDFMFRFNRQKKKQLLRLARRYKALAEKDEKSSQRLHAHKRYFYTLLVYELGKEGKVIGVDDPELNYLNSLFEEPLTQEEMREVAQKYNPSFKSQDEISPIDAMDVEARNKELIGKYHSRRRIGKCKKWLIGAGSVATCLGAILGFKAYEETQAQRSNIAERVEFDQRFLQLFKIRKNVAMDSTEVISSKVLIELENEFGDEQTANAAFLDYSVVYEAIQVTGKKDWKSLEDYFRQKSKQFWENKYSGIDSDDLSDPDFYHYFDKWQAILISTNSGMRGIVDNWAFQYRDSEARKYLDELRAKAKADYEAKTKGKYCYDLPGAGRQCVKTDYDIKGL